jgi:hypothetical protein
MFNNRKSRKQNKELDKKGSLTSQIIPGAFPDSYFVVQRKGLEYLVRFQ